VQALKFHGVRALGRAFGLLLTDELERRTASVDALIPVPLHSSRLRERGYNQAAEIARIPAARLRIPLHLRGIRRVRATAAQATLDLLDRNVNVAGAFMVEHDYTGLRVALVDDVITTGATVNALAAATRSSGAVSVSAWAIARTPELASAGGTQVRAACSALVEIVEQNSDEHCRTEPGIVQECLKASLALAAPDENLLMNAQRRSRGEPTVVPNAKLGASADEHKAHEQ
jgi:ComF family protein